MIVTRAADGSIAFVVNGNETMEIGGVGTVTGSSKGTSSMKIGSTNDGETSLDFFNQNNSNKPDDNMVIVTNSDINNLSFSGNNTNADIESPDNNPNTLNSVTVNTKNSVINSNKTQNNVVFTNDSSNNEVNLGFGYNAIVDSGTYNTTNAKGSTLFITTPTSDGASVNTGYYNDSVLLYGSNALVNTNGGNDSVTIANTGKNNIVDTGFGSNDVLDNGTHSAIFARSGSDRVLMKGLYSTAKVSELITDVDVSGYGNTYDETGNPVSENSTVVQAWYQRLKDYLAGQH
ncbi:MAG: hypothetical protein WC197_03110 [Candidatus Gastranaerophilaceae bacterium]|jgi:hypothetical protein